MFTAEEKEKICQEIYDWTMSSFLAENWQSLTVETKTRILAKMEPYLNKPENQAVLKRILAKFDADAIAEFEATLPYPLATDWELRKQEDLAASQRVPPHMVVSPDKKSVTFYTEEEWAEYQKSVKQ